MDEDRDEELERLRAEIAHLRQTAALRTELTRRGALPEALGLLCGERLLEREEDAAGWADELQRQYGFLFRKEECRPTPPVTPPTEPQTALDRQEIRRMSPAEINRNWDEVRQALARRE